jgi:hypothetical protein
LFAVAVVVAAERIAENAHWLSDTVAGAALGIGGVYLIQWVLMRFFPGISEQHDLEVMVPDPESTATEQPLPAHK